MRIGLASVDFYPNVGGVAAHVVELGRELVRQGHTVDVFSIPHTEERDEISTLDGMTVHRPRVVNRKPLYSWMMARWFKRFLATTRLDVLHVHGLRPVEATRDLGVPVVFTNHTSGFLKRIRKSPWECQRLANRLQHISHVLAPSEELVEATRYVGYAGPVQFIPNGVDTSKFSPGEGTLRESWGVEPSEVAVLLARRMVEKNGVTVFADAVTRLKSQGFRIVFAGDGAERGRVEAILRDGGVIDRCVFLDSVPNTEMPDVYRSAEISVLPSFMEATSITGLESMATGLPLVGTRVGGIPTLIDDSVSGLLVEPHDAAGLAEAMDRLIQNPELLLVDEPTASLDPAASVRIMTLISEVCAESGLAAVINLHDVPLARRFCPRILALHEGRIAFDGPPEELTDTVLTEIYGEEAVEPHVAVGVPEGVDRDD